MDDGTTPLMVAVQKYWKRGVERLLDEGADVNAVKLDNIMALHFAIQYSGGPECERFPISFLSPVNPWTYLRDVLKIEFAVIL